MDMFARRPSFQAVWNVTMVTLDVLNSHNIINVSDYREELFTPLKSICNYLVLDLYALDSHRSGDIEVKALIRRSRPPCEESHVAFLKERFVFVYKYFRLKYAVHVAYMQVWAYSLEVMLRTVRLRLSRNLVRLTGLYLAKFLSSPKFRSECSFETLIRYASVNVESRIEQLYDANEKAWQQRRRYRNRQIGDYTVNQFRVFMDV